jgi:hypothetical protein
MKYLIEFDSVFEADKGIKLINKIRFDEQQKLNRSHHYGILKFEIDQGEYYLLSHYKIGFKELK